MKTNKLNREQWRNTKRSELLLCWITDKEFIAISYNIINWLSRPDNSTIENKEEENNKMEKNVFSVFKFNIERIQTATE